MATPQPMTESPTPAPAETQAFDSGEQVLTAYRSYVDALSRALRQGDASLPALRQFATGPALRDARQRVRANHRDGVSVDGRLDPEADSSDVQVIDGRATVRDCFLNELGWRRDGERLMPPTGDRRPVTATLVRDDERWVVQSVEGPQVRGPSVSGDGCAPPELEAQILAGYQAFWRTFYKAADPGNGRPADPGHPALGRTAVGEQLMDTRASFRKSQASGEVIRSQVDSSAQVLGALDRDRRAVVADCRVVTGPGGSFDAETGEPVERDEVGDAFFVVTDMRLDNGVWKVENYDIEADECTRPE